MLFIIAVLGVIGGVVLGLVGLARGDAGELERILAIACFAMAASGLVGRSARDPSTARVRARRVAIEVGDLITAIAVAPVVALCAIVFLLTLIPSVYVMLPVFTVWWLGSETRRGRHVEPTPLPGPMPEPAVV
jgi:hypothetical protein